MPCNSDYMEPTSKERELRRTAQLLCYVRRELDLPVGGALLTDANDQYCHQDYVPALCALLKDQSPEQQEKIIYNARSREARDLANWWEDHLEADRKRESQDLDRQVRLAALRANVEGAKREAQALGLYEVLGFLHSAKKSL